MRRLGLVSALWLSSYAASAVARLKQELPALTSELRLLRLCSNKKEICAFGTIAR